MRTLEEGDIHDIIYLYCERGYSVSAIAHATKITVGNVWNIVYGKTWTRITGGPLKKKQGV